MVGKLFLAANLAYAAVARQSLDDLRQRYGSPVSETFSIRDGVGVTVNSGSDGHLTEMLIAPIQTGSLAPSRNMTFSKEQAKRILDELLPMSTRGKLLSAGFVNAVLPTRE